MKGWKKTRLSLIDYVMFIGIAILLVMFVVQTQQRISLFLVCLVFIPLSVIPFVDPNKNNYDYWLAKLKAKEKEPRILPNLVLYIVFVILQSVILTNAWAETVEGLEKLICIIFFGIPALVFLVMHVQLCIQLIKSYKKKQEKL